MAIPQDSLSGNPSGSQFTGKSDAAKSILDAVQLAGDIGGTIDPTPITDGINAIISGVRAATAKTAQSRNVHLRNAMISVVSMAPYVGDLAKLGKLGGKAGKATAKGTAKVSDIGPMPLKSGDVGFIGPPPAPPPPTTLGKVGQFFSNNPQAQQYASQALGGLAAGATAGMVMPASRQQQRGMTGQFTLPGPHARDYLPTGIGPSHALKAATLPTRMALQPTLAPRTMGRFAGEIAGQISRKPAEQKVITDFNAMFQRQLESVDIKNLIMDPLGPLKALAANVKEVVFNMEGWAEGLKESRRHLTQFNANIASTFLRSERAEIVRNIGSGARTSGSTEYMVSALDELKDTIQPIRDLISNALMLVLAKIATDLNTGIKVILILNPMLESLLEIQEALEDKAGTLPQEVILGLGGPKGEGPRRPIRR